MKLDFDRVRTWYRADGTVAEQYTMSVDDLVTDVDELRAVIDAGMRITIHAGDGQKGLTSLEFLAPVIAEIRDLRVGTINRVTDAGVLEDAHKLRSLNWAVGSCAERVDLSGLQYLEEFGSSVTRTVASVLRNPALRFLTVEGAIPKLFSRVAGPVEIFEQEGGRSDTSLPVFEQPDQMRSIVRIGPARFDLGQLSGMRRLESFTLKVCNDVVGLSELGRLPELSMIAFNGCSTKERWEDLPMVPEAFLYDIAPLPSNESLAEWQRAGWRVPDPLHEVLAEALVVDEAGDGGSWGVFLSRFDDIADAVDQWDGSVAGGLAGESLVLGVVAELQSEGVVLDAEPDSEGSFTVVYFPDRAQAEQVFARTREALAADVETQLHYLRAAFRRSRRRR